MRHLAPLLVLALLGALATVAAADAPPPPPAADVHIRGIGAAVQATDVPGQADFDLSNDSGAAVTLSHLAVAVWDGGASHPAMVRRITRNGRTVNGPLAIPAGATVRVTVFFDMPEPFRRASRWQVRLSGQTPASVESIPAIITRGRTYPVAR